MLNATNMYAYCNGNPVMYCDPTGMGIMDIVRWVGKVAGEIRDAWSNIAPILGNISNFISKMLFNGGVVLEGFTQFFDFGTTLTNLFVGIGNWAFGWLSEPNEDSPLYVPWRIVSGGLGILTFLGQLSSTFLVPVGYFVAEILFDLANLFGNENAGWVGSDGGIKFDIDATGGFMLIGEDGGGSSAMSAPTQQISTLPTGGGQMQTQSAPQSQSLAMVNNVSLAYLFHNASGNYAGFKHTKLVLNGTVGFSDHNQYLDANVTWATGDNSVSLTQDPAVTDSKLKNKIRIASANYTGQTDVVAMVKNRSGTSLGTARAKVVSIHMAGNPITPPVALLLDAARLTALPNGQGTSIDLIKSWPVFILGYHGNYVFVQTVPPNQSGLRAGFVEWWKLVEPVNDPQSDLITRLPVVQYLAMRIGWPLGDKNGLYMQNGRLMAREDRELNRISAAGFFGNNRGNGPHAGTDFFCRCHGGGVQGCVGKAPIISATSGTVVAVTGNTITGTPGRGYAIAIRSTLRDTSTGNPGNRLIFIYQHMDEGADFIVGDDVVKGQVLGYVGKSDNTTNGGDWHLHYEVSNHTDWQGPGSNRYDRIVNRINPVFFYPADTFVQGGPNATSNNITIWNEVKWW